MVSKHNSNGVDATMPRVGSKSVYNSPIPEMFCMQSFSWRALIFLLVFVLGVLFTSSARAEDWSAPEAELAQKIVALAGRSPIALTVVNRSSLNELQVNEIRGGLQQAITRPG